MVLGTSELSLHVATGFGPRVLSLIPAGGPNLFASLPEATLPGRGGRPYRFVGGHRLWRAPESVAETYVPDDGPVDITESERGVEVSQPVDDSGVQKTLRLRVTDGGAVVDHVLTNAGTGTIRAAAWAITQLVTGGQALVPLGSGGDLQADRSLVLWPYTRLADPGLEIGDREVIVAGTRSDPIKVGTALTRGWLAYRAGDWLFVKRAGHLTGTAYTDLGASGQCYANDQFVELETLSPLFELAPGEVVEHREVWEVRRLGAGETAAPMAQLAGSIDQSL